MGGSSLGDLSAAVEETLAATSNAVRAFFSSLRSKPPAKPPETGITQSGEHARFEESKFYFRPLNEVTLCVSSS
jgi:hypothetical protein